MGEVCDRNRCCTWLSLLAILYGVLRVQISCSGAGTSGVASLMYVLGHAVVSPA